MIDLLITGTLLAVTALLLLASIREWLKERRNRLLVPVVAWLLALMVFVFDPFFLGVPWLAGFTWLTIGVILRVVVRISKTPR